MSGNATGWWHPVSWLAGCCFWLSSTVGCASFDSPFSGCERTGQALADAAARGLGQQRSAMRRGHHPAAEQRERVGPRRPHRPAPRRPERPHRGTAGPHHACLLTGCDVTALCAILVEWRGWREQVGERSCVTEVIKWAAHFQALLISESFTNVPDLKLTTRGGRFLEPSWMTGPPRCLCNIWAKRWIKTLLLTADMLDTSHRSH